MKTTALTDFFLFSPPKTGSTSLFNILAQHPQTSPYKIKEPNYFYRFYNDVSREDYNKGYLNASNVRLNFEASTDYFSSQVALERIVKDSKSTVKFVVVLRNPVDRFISHYVHFRAHYEMCRNLEMQKNFLASQNSEWVKEWQEQSQYFAGIGPEIDKIIEMGHNHFLAFWSLYPRTIKNLREKVDPERVLFIIYEDFKRDNVGTLARICHFLNIHSWDFIMPQDNTSEFWKPAYDATGEIKNHHIQLLYDSFRTSILETEKLLNRKLNWL